MNVEQAEKTILPAVMRTVGPAADPGLEKRRVSG
jgi:hypothetical protein